MFTSKEIVELLSPYGGEFVTDTIVRAEAPLKGDMDTIVRALYESEGETNEAVVSMEWDGYSVEINTQTAGEIVFRCPMMLGNQIITVEQEYAPPRDKGEFRAPSGRNWEQICAMFRRMRV